MDRDVREIDADEHEETPYLKGVLGEAAAAAARTDTFLGQRCRRLVKRRGKLKALVAVARSWSSSGTCSPIRRPLCRPRLPLLRATHQHGTQNPRPRPPATSPRPPSHPQPSRLNLGTVVPSGAPPRTPTLARHRLWATHD